MSRLFVPLQSSTLTSGRGRRWTICQTKESSLLKTSVNPPRFTARQTFPRPRRTSLSLPPFATDLLIRASTVAGEEQTELLYLRACVAHAHDAFNQLRAGDELFVSARQHLGLVLVTMARALRKNTVDHGGEAQIFEAVMAAQDASALLAHDLDQHANAVSELAECLLLHFAHNGDQDALMRALEIQRTLQLSCPVDHPCRPSSLSGLAMALMEQCRQVSNNLTDLDESIRLHHEALALCPDDHSERGEFLNRLGFALQTRYYKTESSADFEGAFYYHRLALDARPLGHPYRAKSLLLFGLILLSAYEMRGMGDGDLWNAVSHLREAAIQTPLGHPRRPPTLCALGRATRQIYLLTGEASKLEEAMGYQQAATQLCSYGYSGRVLVFAELGLIFRARFDLNGSEDDLDGAIHSFREALRCSPGNFHHYKVMGDLAEALHMRYQCSGNADDFQDAIQLCRDALTIEKTARMGRAEVLINLARILESEHSALDHDNFTEIAILSRSALAHLPPKTFGRVEALCLLARALHAGSELRDFSRDVSMAETLAKEALSLCAKTHPNYVQCLCTYVMIVYSAARQGVSVVSVHGLWELLNQTSSHAILGNAGRAKLLIAKFYLRLLPGESTFDIADALLNLRWAMTDVNCGVRWRLQSGLAALAALDTLRVQEENEKEMLLDVYLSIVSLMSQVSLRSIQLQDQVRALQDAERLTLDATVFTAHCGRLTIAVEVLEHGRAIFWSRALQLRTAFDGLPLQYREELISLSRAVENASFNVRKPEQSGRVTDEISRTHRLQNVRIEGLLHEIRIMPGYERFLLPPEFSSISAAAAKGPVVILIAGRLDCMALAINQHENITQIRLPSVTIEVLERWGETVRGSMDELMRGRISRSRGDELSWPVYQKTRLQFKNMLEELWLQVVHRIFLALKMKPSIGRARSRLWWCSTGAFSFLPIHASGTSQRGERCTDYVVSSYTPTLSALLKARNKFAAIARDNVQALLAAAPVPFEDSWIELPGTEEEVLKLQSIIPEANRVFLRGNENGTAEGHCSASMEAVENKLPAATVLHLSSHGFQDPENPLSSGFVMSDGMLTIERLMRLSLPNAFLAFLSACETAKGDQKQPDQAIHLAAAMLFVGFRSVIGTMWSIDENDGIFVATEFYRRLFTQEKETIDADDVAYALDEAVEKLRESSDHPGRWASHIHLGM